MQTASGIYIIMMDSGDKSVTLCYNGLRTLKENGGVEDSHGVLRVDYCVDLPWRNLFTFVLLFRFFTIYCGAVSVYKKYFLPYLTVSSCPISK